jgi:hypothetical protein
MSALSKFWHDSMTVSRWVDIVEDGITSQTLTEVHNGVKCHYSKGSLSVIGTDGSPTLINSYKIFCGINEDVLEGDIVTVTQRNGKTVDLTVGEGFPYTDHQEFTVKRNGKA